MMIKIIFVLGTILLTLVNSKVQENQMKELFASVLGKLPFSPRPINPSKVDLLIKNINTKLITIASTVDKAKINTVGSLGIPPHAVEKFKAAVYAKDATSSSFQIEIFPDKASAIEGLGVIKIEGDQAKIAYAEAHTKAELIEQFNLVNSRECHGWWIWRKCHTVTNKVSRGFTLNELYTIKREVKHRSSTELSKRLNDIQELQNVE